MAITQVDLDRLISAKMSGVLEVEQDGKRVKYRSMTEIDRAIAYAQMQLAGSVPINRSTHADFS
jgi:hypothetical protein